MSFIDRIQNQNGMIFAKDIIQSYMKKNNMNNIEEFLKECPTLKDFESKTRMNNYVNIIRNHGVNINEDIYKEIIEMIKKEELSKKSIQTENIETAIINGHEIATVTDKETGKKITYDNTVSNNSIENQMKNVQNEHQQFQSLNNNNTLNIMNYMKDNVKITPDTQKSNNINENKLSNEEILINNLIKNFEIQVGHPVDIDLNSKMIYDNGIVYTIEKRGDNYEIIEQNTSQKEKPKGLQLTKKKNEVA